MSAPAPPPTPTVIAGRYELQRMLAQGGMAEVWLAIDTTLDRKVAVKWLKPALAADEIVAERFRREAVAAASLNHPNIVAVHDVFEQDGRQAVVMQLVEGKSLRQVLDTQKRLSPELTCHIGGCVAAALDHAHAAGFVHRDVKPGNIMMTSDGRVLLTDFGIAKGLQSAEADLTSDNIMMGTAKYLSPEQVRGKRLDGRADLYSLGLVLYECLAGRVPFLGETDADTALARLQRDPTDLNRLRATLPTGLVVVIHELLSRNPAHRPQTGTELVHQLRDAAQAGAPTIDPTPYERPNVAPIGGRRLRRAPSDAADESDRRRPVAPVPGTTTGTIPGEVAHVVGAAPPTEPPLDDTPRGGATRGRPARGLTQEWKPAFAIVAVLVVVGLAVAAVLWTSLEFGGGDPEIGDLGLDDAADTDDTAAANPVAPAPSTAPTPAPGPASIATITAYDPEGDGAENDADAVLSVADGASTTTWSTSCYSDRFMGAKRGVGLVVSFDALAQQALTVDVATAPYQVSFFAVADETIPPTIDGWGDELGTTQFDSEPGTVVSPVPATPARHVLVLLRELGADGTCSDANPFRGRLGEIAPVG